MRKYETIIKPLSLVLAVITTIVLLAAGLRMGFAKTTEERAEDERVDALRNEWQTQCATLGVGEVFNTKVKKIGGKRFCVKVQLVDGYPIDDSNAWERGCKELAGTVAYVDGGRGCFSVDVVEELGTREDYVR